MNRLNIRSGVRGVRGVRGTRGPGYEGSGVRGVRGMRGPGYEGSGVRGVRGTSDFARLFDVIVCVGGGEGGGGGVGSGAWLLSPPPFKQIIQNTSTLPSLTLFTKLPLL